MKATKNDINAFSKVCRMRQPGVLRMMSNILSTKYNRIISTPSYIIALGEIPVGLVAHADTVFPVPPKTIFHDAEASVMWSPEGLGADDRAGIFAILKILTTNLRPHIIITTDEEYGGIGAAKMLGKFKDFPAELNFLVELDRRGTTDSVFYECYNHEFEKYINDFGFVTSYGSFSDISILAPAYHVSAVNLSVGYENEHSVAEFVNLDALFDTIEKVINILLDVKHDSKNKKFDFVDFNHINDFDDCDCNGDIKPNSYGFDKETCYLCGEKSAPEDLIPVYYNANEPPMYMCNSCFAESYTTVHWCKECHKGWIAKADEIDTPDEDYVCPECKGAIV